MPDNNTSITIKLNDGRTEQWSLEQYERNKERLYAKYPDAEAVRTSVYNPEEGYDATDVFGVRLKDGRTEQWIPAQIEKSYDRLISRFPDAEVTRVSNLATQYWKPKADAALGRLQAIGGQNSDFERRYVQNLKQSLALDTHGVNESQYHDFVNENRDKFSSLRREREELRREYFNNPWVRRQAGQAADTATQLRDEYRRNMDAAQTAEERRDWRRAAKLQDDIRKIYEAPNKYVEDVDDVNGFAKFLSDYSSGAIDKFTDQDFYTFGLSAISRNFDLRGIAEKIEGARTDQDIDQILTPGEKAQILSFYQLADAQRKRADGISSGYSAGESFADSIKFMAEFLLSTGVANVAGKAISGSSNALASWLGRQLMSEKALTRAIGKGVTAATQGSKAALFAEEYLAKPIIQGLWHTATQLSSLESISEGLLETDSNGRLVSTGRAIGKGLLDSIIENWSESFGGAIEKTMALPFKGLGWAGEHTIGNTTFGRWARWLYNSAPTQLLKEAGFNGMIGEIGEEWAGNAVRVGLGLMSKEEFKDFASWEQQLEMAASFAPLSLVGLGTSSAAAIRKSGRYNKLSGMVKDILQRQGRSQEEIDNLFSTRYDTPEDVGRKLAPYLREISMKAQANGATKQDAEDYRTINDFAEELGIQAITEEMDNIAKNERREKMRDDLTATIGRFWQVEDGNEGQPPRQTVRVVSDAEGNNYYVTGQDASGMLISVSRDGKPHFVKPEDIAEDNTYSMDEFLQGQLNALDADEEARRMNEERIAQINAVKQTLAENPVVPMGTPEAPKDVPVVATNDAGVFVTLNEEGQPRQQFLSWTDVASYLGTPIEVRTDEQLEQDAAAALDAARDRLNTYKGIVKGTAFTVNYGEEGYEEQETLQFERAVIEDGQIMIYGKNEQGETVPVTEEMVENLPGLVTSTAKTDENPFTSGQKVSYQDDLGNVQRGVVTGEDNGGGYTFVTLEDGTPATVQTARLNMETESSTTAEAPVEKYTNEQGKVNQTAFMNQEPEEWARWNDGRRQDGGADSLERLSASIGQLDKQINDLNTKKSSTSNPDDAEALEEQMNELTGRRNRLAAIVQGYVAKQEAEAAAREEANGETPATENEPKSATDRIRKDNKGNMKFEEASEEDTAAALVELAGGDARLAMTSAKGMIAKRRDDIRKTEKSKVTGADPVQIMQNTRAKEQKIQELKDSRDYWSRVVDELRKLLEAQISVERRTAQELNVPQTLKEVVANYLASIEPNTLNREDFQRELGWGNTEMQSFFRFWAKKGTGKALISVAEDLAADDQSGFVPQDATGLKDTEAVRNAIIDVMSEVSGPGELKNYTRNANLERLAEMEESFAGPVEEGSAQEEAPLSNSSEGYLAEQNESVPDLVPTQESTASSENEGGSSDGLMQDSASPSTPVAPSDNSASEGKDNENTDKSSAPTEESVPDVVEDMPSDEEFAEAGLLTDKQGNPIDANGRFIVARLDSATDITDEDIENPTRNVELPPLPGETDAKVKANGRNVLIKRSDFIKNKKDHPELSPNDSRAILERVLAKQKFFINDKPSNRPNYWVLVNVDGKYALAVIDSDPNKTHVEIVGWRWSNEKDVERIKNRAISEGGQVLITNTGAAGLSALQENSESKDSDNSEETSASGENLSQGALDFNEEIKHAREEVDTNPTDAQKEVGNYKKGHVTIDGYKITIENPKGSVRSGTDADGNPWSVTMNNDYGYIRMTEGVDGDHIDVFLSDNPTEGNVFVVDQVNPQTGEFDEHKVMYGFPDAESARAAYLANYSPGWRGLGIITEVTRKDFKKWVGSSHRKTKPFYEYKSVQSGLNGQLTVKLGELTDAQRKALEFIGAEVPEETAQEKESKSTQRKAEILSVAEELNAKEEEYNRLYSEWLSSDDDSSREDVQKRLALGKEQRELERKLRKLVSEASPEELEELGRVENKAIAEVLKDLRAQQAVRRRRSRISAIIAQKIGKLTGAAKALGKFNPTKYQAPKGDARVLMTGTFHDGGYAVSSDTHIRVADKETYDKKHEGKVIGQDGQPINGQYPKWRDLFSLDLMEKQKMDFGKLRDFLAQIKEAQTAKYEALSEEEKKRNKKKDMADRAKVVLNLGEDHTIGFYWESLSKFADYAERIGAKEIYFTDERRAVAAKSPKGMALLMPIQLDYKERNEPNEEWAADFLMEGGTYSYGQNAYQKRIAKEVERQKPLQERLAKWRSIIGDVFEVLTSLDDAFAITSESAKNAFLAEKANGGAVHGFYDTESGKAYLYLPDIADTRQLDRKILHEVISHKGLAGVMGEQGFAEFCDKVWNEMMSAEARKEFLEYVNGSAANVEDRRRAADEYIAHVAEHNTSIIKQLDATDWEKFVNAVKEILNDMLAEDFFDTGMWTQFDQELQKAFDQYRTENADAIRQADAERAKAKMERQEDAVAAVEGEQTKAVLTGEATANPQVPISRSQEKYEDWGEKIGMARKDTAVKGAKKGDGDSRPAWMKKYRTINVQQLPEHLRGVGGGYGFTEVLHDITKGTDHTQPFVAFYEQKSKGYWGGVRKRYITDGNRQPIIFTSIEQYEATLPVFEVRDQDYRIREKGGKFVIYRLASNNKPVEYASFDTREEAVAYLASPEGCTELLNRKRENYELPDLERLTRNGMPDYRAGRNVTPEDYQKTFGFRGGEFGNWLNAAEQQQFLNTGYDALMDLANLLGVTPMALTLNGELSISFGARGRGGAQAAAAHYEANRAVINMTKMHGAGSLAHEWAHALDNYFGLMDAQRERIRDDKATDNNRVYLTEGRSIRKGVRKEVADAFKEVMSTLTRKEVTRQIALDQAQSDYNLALRRATKRLSEEREDFARGKTEYKYNRKTKQRDEVKTVPTDEQMARFDQLADQLLGDKDLKYTWDWQTQAWKGESETADKMYALVKEIFPKGWSAYRNLENVFDSLDKLNRTRERLEKAQTGEQETVTVETDMARDSKWFDRDRAGSYWTKDVEIFARAFEEYLAYKMRLEDKSSDYLTYTKGPLYLASWDHSPYPMGDELMAARDAFDKLFKTIQEKTDEQTGRQVLFSRAYHGTGADFDMFDSSHMGEGEGNQVFGWGTYVTFNRDPAVRFSTHGADFWESQHTAEEKESIKNRFVPNVIVDSTKTKLPANRKEAIEIVNKMNKPFINDDQGKEFVLSNSDIKHIATQDNSHRKMDLKCLGVIDRIIKNAVKIGNDAIKPDEVGHTHLVEVYYCPIEIDSEQYSARLTVKQYENRGVVLDDIHLYDLASKPKKPVAVSRGTGAKALTPTSASGLGYKVKDLIHSTKKEDQKLLGITDRSSLLFSKSNDNQSIFISNAERAVRDLKMDKATPGQWKKTLEKNGGLKAAEDKWLGLSTWLDGLDRKTVTKQEVLDYINENKIQIEEVPYYEGRQRIEDMYSASIAEVLGAPVGEAYYGRWRNAYGAYELSIGGPAKDVDATKDMLAEKYGIRKGDYGDLYSYIAEVPYPRVADGTRAQYTTAGLSDNREIAFTVPAIESWNKSDRIHFGDAGEGRAIAWVRFGDAIIPTDEVQKAEAARADFFERMREKYGKRGQNLIWSLNDSDYNELKRLLHELHKAQNKTAARVLFIDEIQSKRHQEARERGGYKDEAKLAEATERVKRMMRYYGVHNIMQLEDAITNEQDYKDLKEFKELQKAIPAAPFEKNWHELAMKRMLRLAAEEGYDYVAWTTGNQQAKRYDLGQVVQSIQRLRELDSGEVRYDVYDHEGWGRGVFVKGGVITRSYYDVLEGKRMEEVFGKGLAEKMLALDDGESLSGDNIRIAGGEGMVGFYDEILPRFMNKYGKKWGVKVEDMQLPGLEYNGIAAHAVPVTEEMKESVMRGQLMFSREAADRKDGESAYGFASRSMREIKKQYNVPGLNWAVYNKENPKSAAHYDPNNKSLVIFANEDLQTYAQVEEDAIHELCHAAMDYLGTDVDGLFARFKERLGEASTEKALNDLRTRGYKEYEYPEEFIVHYLTSVAVSGNAHRIAKELKEDTDKIYKTFGYDPEKEISRGNRSLPGSERGGSESVAVRTGQTVPGTDSLDGRGSEGARAGAGGRPGGNDQGNGGVIRFSKESAEKASKEGIGGVVGQDNVSDFYMQIYRALPQEMRRGIAEKAVSNGGNIREAVQEVVSDAARKGEDGTGLLRMAETMLQDYAGGEIDDNTLRYILWRGERGVNDGNILALVEDRAMYNRMVARSTGVRFSVGESVSAADAAAESSIDEAKSALDKGKKDIRDLVAATKAMGLQKEYDKKTVETVANLAKQLLKDQNVGDLNRREILRLLGIVRTSVGRAPKTVKKNADAIVEIVIDHLLRGEKDALKKITNTTGVRQNASGVSVQGELDVRGQNIMKAYNEGIKKGGFVERDGIRQVDTSFIDGMIGDIQDDLDNPNDAVRKAAEARQVGLELAKSYWEGVQKSNLDEQTVKEAASKAKKDFEKGDLSRMNLNEILAQAETEIRNIHIESIERHRELRAKIQQALSGSVDAMREFRDKEKRRVEHIHHIANSDMEGVPTNKPGSDDAFVNGALPQTVLGPLYTHVQFFKLLGRKNPYGRGYLYEYYVRKWREAQDAEYLGMQQSMSVLDAKVEEIFGKGKKFSDLFAISRSIDHENRKNGKVDTMTYLDSGVMTEHDLTMGQLLYIYMVNKMSDGKMKLRRMGISEEQVEAIHQQLDERFVRFADWVQDEFLVDLRNRYNVVHESVFGASMAGIDNYFPLRIDMRDIKREDDISKESNEIQLPSAVTGSIINRTRNNRALDLNHTDALAVLYEHVQEMEHWAAFAEYIKDVNTLLSYRRFQNQLTSMKTVFGTGDKLLQNFRTAMKISAGAYRPKVSDAEKLTNSVARSVSTAKISLRLWTALKQFASISAFMPDVTLKNAMRVTIHPIETWKWCMENLPSFAARWGLKNAGDEKLLPNDKEWKMLKKEFVKKLAEIGLTPNRFIDSVTVSLGARAVYLSKYESYKQEGYSDEVADKRAKQDAEISFNETQQSSENAFLSALQKDRTFVHQALTVFRNSSFGFTRRSIEAARNLRRMAKKGYEEESVKSMTKQLMRDGLSEEQATAAAQKRYSRAFWYNLTTLATNTFVNTFLWNLSSHIIYLLFGDDDDKKLKYLEEDALHALFGGWAEGFALGNVFSDKVGNIVAGESPFQFSPSLSPIMSDIENLGRKLNSDPVAGVNDLVNLAVQAGLGVNPQTITDAVVAVIDACNGDLGTCREAMFLILRIMQVPQSQLDELYIDELDTTAGAARKMTPKQLAERYADYKLNKNVPLTRWAYDEETAKRRHKAYEQQFKKKVKERND